MTLSIVHDDLFRVIADTKVIPTNMYGAMGKGVAKIARDHIPGLYEHYLDHVETIRPNQFILYKYAGTNYLMVPTKIHWRNPSPRDLVVQNLRKLAAISAQFTEMGTVALPAMGCGEGGLDWDNDISHIYEEVFGPATSEFICCLL